MNDYQGHVVATLSGQVTVQLPRFRRGARGGNEMVVADNQEPVPHLHFAGGQGRTSTKFFICAPAKPAKHRRGRRRT